jgi:hypothetical protein
MFDIQFEHERTVSPQGGIQRSGSCGFMLSGKSRLRISVIGDGVCRGILEGILAGKLPSENVEICADK